MAGLLDSLSELNRLATNAAMPFGMSLLPANARMLAKSMVMPTGVSAADFSPQELDVMRQAYLNSQNRSTSDYANANRQRLSELGTVSPDEQVFSQFQKQFVPSELEKELLISSFSPTIQYADYPVKDKSYGVGNMPVAASFTDPSYSMSTTIGRAKYNTDPQGNVHITDTYDFARGKKMADYKNWSVPFQLAHGFGEQYSNPMPVDINIGTIDQILKRRKAK